MGGNAEAIELKETLQGITIPDLLINSRDSAKGKRLRGRVYVVRIQRPSYIPLTAQAPFQASMMRDGARYLAQVDQSSGAGSTPSCQLMRQLMSSVRPPIAPPMRVPHRLQSIKLPSPLSFIL